MYISMIDHYSFVLMFSLISQQYEIYFGNAEKSIPASTCGCEFRKHEDWVKSGEMLNLTTRTFPECKQIILLRG